MTSWAWRLAEVRWAALATVLFFAGLTVWVADGPGWLAWPLFLACYGAGGWEPARAGLRALRDKILDVDLLMVLAAIVAAAVGQILDGALLIVIFATSGALEAVATQHTARAVRGLLDLTPEKATRLHPDGTEQIVAAAVLDTGDVVLVRPGERIAADGQVLAGTSDVDQATITGEPLPAVKAPGEPVFAGTRNGNGALTVQVSRPAADSVVARIAAMVTEAAATKARTQLFIEKIEQRYSAGMIGATLLLLFIPLLAGEAFRPALLRAMTFMIVASPCAVMLATMPPLLAAMANASRHGVLVKSAIAMEQVGMTDLVAFDKTGTLTEGTPRLVQIVVLPGAEYREREILELAAAAENPSEHPLGRAIVAAAREADLPAAPPDQFTAIPGWGVQAVVQRRQVEIGRPVACLPAVAQLEGAGQTAVVMCVDGVPAAVLGVADRIRPAARGAVARIVALTGREPVLLTGDNQLAAELLAGHAGIADVRAGLLPADKAGIVLQMRAAGRNVLLAGDGINDAPGLAAAHTGVAMGRAGSDLALDTADVVIMRDDLATIPASIALSRHARRVVSANLGIAATIIAGLVTWDLAGHLPLPLGVLGHEGSTVIVGLNGLRLLRRGIWVRATA